MSAILFVLVLTVSSVQAADTNGSGDIVGISDDQPVIAASDSDEIVAASDDEPIVGVADDKAVLSASKAEPTISSAKEVTVAKSVSSQDAQKIGKSISADDNQKVGKAKSTKKVRTFSALATKINNAKPNSVLVVSGVFKYSPRYDSEYKEGIPIMKNIKIVGKHCIVDGRGKARCFGIHEGKVTLRSITIRNGYMANGNGGGILLNTHCKLILKKCVLKNNVAYKANGGAVACNDHTILISSDSKFYYNKAIRASSKKWPYDQRGMGGAIEMNPASKLSMYNSLFKRNYGFVSNVLVMSNSNGVIKTSSVYVKNCVFTRNTADINGAFYLDEYGKGKFINSKFKNNNVRKEGGALVLDASKSALVKNCHFSGNTGYVGGAIDLFKFKNSVSHVTITGCKFIKNKARNAGGAIYSYYGILKVVKSQFISNSAASSGGAIFLEGGKFTNKNNKFVNNKAPKVGPNYYWKR